MITEKEGATELLNNKNPLKWVQRVNGIKARVEEAVGNNLLYIVKVD